MPSKGNPNDDVACNPTPVIEVKGWLLFGDGVKMTKAAQKDTGWINLVRPPNPS